MNISLDSARLAKIMNDAVEQTFGTDASKHVKFGGKDRSISVSYTDDAGRVYGGKPVDLEPADVDNLADPAAMERLLLKLSPEIKLDDKGVREFLKCLGESLGNALKTGKVPLPDGSKLDIGELDDNGYLTIFAIVALMQEAARKMKAAAVASREASLKSEIQSIMNQAAQEKEMAWGGMVAAFCVMGLQVGIGGLLKYKEIRADTKANHEFAKQGVDMNKMLMDDTMKLGDVNAAKDCMDARAVKLDSVATMKGIAAEVGGFKVDEKTGQVGAGSPVEQLNGLQNQADHNGNLDVANKKVELDQTSHKLHALENAPVKEPDEAHPKYRFAEQDFDTKELAEEAKNKQVGELKQKVETLKGDLVRLMDGKVQNIADGLELAQDELARAEADGSVSKDQLGNLKRNVEIQRNNLVYANAVRNYALSEPMGAGDKNGALIDGRQVEGRVSAAHMSYKESFRMASSSLQHETWRISGEKWGAAGRAFDSIGQFLGALGTQLPEIIKRDKVAEQASMTKESEAAYMSANDLVQAANETQQKIIRLFDSAIQSNLQSGRMV